MITHHIEPRLGQIDSLTLTAPDGAQVQVSQLGAHVTSWRTPDGIERLFTSSAAIAKVGGAIRGGIPVIFPQFAGMGPLVKHGFARGQLWTFAGVEEESGHAVAYFTLRDNAATRADWPHAFLAEISVIVGGPRLQVNLAIENTGASPFSFTAALHTYLRVGDVRTAQVDGLAGAFYLDSADGGKAKTQEDTRLTIDGEVDRIYVNVPHSVRVQDGSRRVTIGASSFPDVVVWNPGAAKATAIADLEPDGYLRMLCVESAAIDNPITLQAGERWQGSQTLQV